MNAIEYHKCLLEELKMVDESLKHARNYLDKMLGVEPETTPFNDQFVEQSKQFRLKLTEMTNTIDEYMR